MAHIFLSFTLFSLLKGVFWYYFFDRLIWFIFENSRNKGKLIVKDLLCGGVALSMSTLYQWVWLLTDGWGWKDGTLNYRMSGEGISYGGRKRRKRRVELRKCMVEFKILFLANQSKLISVLLPWEWGEE